MLHQIRNNLLANNLSETSQSAYRAHRSTETTLLNVMKCLFGNAHEGRLSILTLLGLSAAFGTLDHSILLALYKTCLAHLATHLNGFRRINLINSSLSVSTVGFFSQKKLHYAVPQGSVSGPILFTLYFQPLCNIISQSRCNHHKCADDSQLH